MQEQITSQMVEMSPVYQDVVVRNRDFGGGQTSRQIDTTERSPAAAEDEANGSQEAASNSNPKHSFTKLLKNIYEHMDQIRYRLQKDTYKRCTNNEWLLVGTLVDKILFFAYCSIVIFCTMTIFKN